MTWTLQRPTEQGWYWWREDEGTAPVVVRVTWDTVASTSLYAIAPPDSIWTEGAVMDLATVGGFWSGPLLAPAAGLSSRVGKAAPLTK